MTFLAIQKEMSRVVYDDRTEFMLREHGLSMTRYMDASGAPYSHITPIHRAFRCECELSVTRFATQYGFVMKADCRYAPFEVYRTGKVSI